MHNVLNQPQYYNALKGRGQNEETGFSFNGVIKAFQPRPVPDEPENETDVEDCIRWFFKFFSILEIWRHLGVVKNQFRLR